MQLSTRLSPQHKGKDGLFSTSESNVPHQEIYDGNNLPKISIVTPSYNQGDYIEKSIQSVLLQEYPNLEYIVVDGGSTDVSVSIIEKYASLLTWWASEPDEGQYAAINKGFKRTTGEIMLWLNSDDMLAPGSLWIISEVFRRFPKVEWISGIPFYWNKDGSAVQVLPQLPFNRCLMRFGGYEGRAIHWVMQECTAWRRCLWNRAGGAVTTRLAYAGDYELWLRFSSHAQLYTVAAFLGGNRQHSEQKTSDQSSYFEDIDTLLHMRPIVWLCNSLMRFNPVRKILRAWLLVRRRKHHIWLDAKRNQWNLQ